MKIGIISSPLSGKSTIFKILLGNKDVSGNIGVFRTSDSRVEKIAQMSSSKKFTCPEFTFMDLGVMSGFNKKDLSQLQDIELFVCVIGAFFSENPKKDLEETLADIMLFDLETIEMRIARLRKEKKGPDKEKELGVLEKCQAFISEGRLLSSVKLGQDEIKLLSGLIFLSLRPLVLTINLPEGDMSEVCNKIIELERYCNQKNVPHVEFFGKTELELMDLEPAERGAFKVEGKNYIVKDGDVINIRFSV